MQETRTYLDVFMDALKVLAQYDPETARQLQTEWEAVTVTERLAELNELAMTDEYFAGRHILMMGGDHRGEARAKDDGGFMVTLLYGDATLHHVETLDEAKDIMVLQYRDDEEADA